ncbi:MAG: hypothetical protein IJB96_00575 [Lachnospira sp.]|nr:hypothetical protein [Lachnospira sp.]
MRKTKKLILALCMLLTVAGCNVNSDSKYENSSAANMETVSGNAPSEKEIHILDINRSTLYESEWSEQYGVTLVESEYSAVLLSDKDAKNYPELAAVLSGIAANQKSNMKEEYDTLIALAKEKIAYGTDGFETLVSVNDSQVRRADNIVLSVLTDSYLDNGIIRGYRGFWGSNYDTETGKELLFTDVVTDVDKFANAVENKLFSTMGKNAFYSETVIKDYFKNYVADGLHWTIDYNGVTVYFSEREITDASIGAVTITFADYPELFKEKYAVVPNAYIVELPMKTAFYADFDNDKSYEALTVSDQYDGENNYHATVDICMGENTYTESFWAYGCEPYYVKTADGRQYVYLFAELETQMYLYVYNIVGEMISKVGEVNVTPYYNDGLSTVLTDPDNMHFEIYNKGTGGGVSEQNAFFSVGSDGLPSKR